MDRQRRIVTSIVAALLVLEACTGSSQAAHHLGSMTSAAPALVWRTIAPMPTAREGLGAAVGPDGSLYTVGGGTDHYDRLYKCYAVVEAYNPRTNTWSKRASLPQPMCGVTAGFTSAGKLVAVGGSTVQGGEQASRITTATGTILALNGGARRWTVLTRAPFPRKHAGAVIDPNGTVYVIGGADAFGRATASVQRCTRCATG